MSSLRLGALALSDVSLPANDGDMDRREIFAEGGYPYISTSSGLEFTVGTSFFLSYPEKDTEIE
jgi:hypothetical protein